MRIDLSYEPLYKDDVLVLDSRANYIFGKNGTGKSTITKLIKQQYADEYDIRIFQGFKSIVGSDDKIDAVILGEENNAIQAQIEKKQKSIESYKIAKEDLLSKITLPLKPDSKNLATMQIVAEKNLNKTNKDIEKFFSDAAKRIKQQNTPPISIPSYNKSHFAKDVAHAAAISDKDREQYIKTLMSVIKTAPSITFPSVDLEQLIDEVNELMKTKVEEKIVISRLENDSEKRAFAQNGLRIHKKGDVCSFCGNVIKDDEYEKLESYFSADETKELQRRIAQLIDEIKDDEDELEGVSIDSEEFYPDYVEDINELNQSFLKAVIDYGKIFDDLLTALDKKSKNLFESLPEIKIEKLPSKIRDFSARYNALKNDNNASDLKKIQEDARIKLRLDAVKKELDSFNYSGIEAEKKTREDELKKINSKIDGVYEDIKGIESKIRKIQKEIVELQRQTSSEARLADDINQKISRMVDFELEHYEDYDHKGYYRIKDSETNESRPVTQLSTGEKNLIAFLYFMEKLNEIRDTAINQPKLIIFDDPMNSNDESMQHIIVDELKNLIYKTKKSNGDIIITLTHNIGFYSGITEAFYDEEDFKNNTVIRLVKEKHKTSIKRITTRRENIKSGYGMNWEDLIMVYKNDDLRSEMMLNPMRRIIESYTSFNGYNKYVFCQCVNGFINLLNAGSHASKDFNDDTCAYDKDSLVRMLYDCFKGNGVAMQAEHFWPGIKRIASV